MAARLAHNTPIYFTEEIRRIESLAATLADSPRLMERAGLAAAELARELAGNGGKPVLVLAGPGNNGGDAFVIARHLKQWWFNVSVVFTGEEDKLSADAGAALRAWRDAGGEIVKVIPAQQDWSLIVDGLFGIGLQRAVTAQHADLIAAANCSSVPVLAVDVPSGLESDTGRVLGCAIRARHTVTFIGLKPGLLTLDGPDHCGDIHVQTLGLDAPVLLPPHGAVIGPELLQTVLTPRPRNSHKGDFGSVGILGGAHGMVGAALLAGRAALKLGAGRVYVGLIADGVTRVDAGQPELMLRTADEVMKLDHLNCLAVGPGLGLSPDAAYYLQLALQSALPLVIDADGLNLVARDSELGSALGRRGAAPIVLTPHPAEAARLLGRTTREVQDDRLAATRSMASRFNCHVVLKGAGSVCASPDNTWAVNTSGNPGMATAGMGDVLTGMIAALLAQNADPRNALSAAVYLHGAAADELVRTGVGPTGLTAGEVIDAARRLINDSR